MHRKGGGHHERPIQHGPGPAHKGRLYRVPFWSGRHCEKAPEATGRRRGGNQAHRVGLRNQRARLGIKGDPRALRRGRCRHKGSSQTAEPRAYLDQSRGHIRGRGNAGV